MDRRRASMLVAPALGAALAPTLAMSEARAAPVDAALTRWDMASARTLVSKMPRGADRCLAEGVIASRENRLREADALLSSCIPPIDSAGSKRMDLAMSTLIDVYRRQGDYARQYDLIDRWLKAHADAKGTDDYAAYAGVGQLALALRDVKPIDPTGAATTSLRTYVNPLGTRSVDLNIKGVTLPWMVDTGANYSVLSESAARRLGVKVKNAHFDVLGATGHTVTTPFAVVEELPIGGITLHNVIVIVAPDAALRMKSARSDYQIEAALGYPALAQLGRFKVDAKGWLTIDRAGPLLRSGARLYMDQLTPLVEVDVAGRKRLLKVDTGATRTTLFASYAARYRKSADAWRRSSRTSLGLGGATDQDVAITPELKMAADGRSIMERDVSIELKGDAGNPILGNLGQPLLMANGGYTFDFRSMRVRFGVDEPDGTS